MCKNNEYLLPLQDFLEKERERCNEKRATFDCRSFCNIMKNLLRVFLE